MHSVKASLRIGQTSFGLEHLPEHVFTLPTRPGRAAHRAPYRMLQLVAQLKLGPTHPRSPTMPPQSTPLIPTRRQTRPPVR